MHVQAADPAVVIASPAAERMLQATGRRSAERVLIVEDSPSDAALVRRMLRDGPSGERFQPVVAGSAAAAITALSAHQTACVLLDLG
ncbi:MAG TPA: hypothetical protein VEY89_08090, partial [Candidatus Dormibacteraeota bacterium]|nr:hypothetical protein [Candidatus Dormibacteraeota bacterium]